MTTIIYADSKIIQIRHNDNKDLQKVLKGFNSFEVVKNYADIRKINKTIDTPEFTKHWYQY